MAVEAVDTGVIEKFVPADQYRFPPEKRFAILYQMPDVEAHALHENRAQDKDRKGTMVLDVQTPGTAKLSLWVSQFRGWENMEKNGKAVEAKLGDEAKVKESLSMIPRTYLEEWYWKLTDNNRAIAMMRKNAHDVHGIDLKEFPEDGK